ncbi:hypothetical protein CBM2599_B51208 [Cupriavidus taiwanensis]|uniref:Uncharacterized protein n=1 Tax=Cupriavidus taiwanensis TaxID=164546 RepID=A0A976AR97_9BURK|nr:hypothetical protein CBM2599_B51208 [Cupriavidus taiwanensis]SOZ00192.1 hypothetical protein CBM2600_B70218 [Cupriavidus taiwanensis]SPD68137.1 protein of unknown function [Cupriavidus taiwanensis]
MFCGATPASAGNAGAARGLFGDRPAELGGAQRFGLCSHALKLLTDFRLLDDLGGFGAKDRVESIKGRTIPSSYY